MQYALLRGDAEAIDAVIRLARAQSTEGLGSHEMLEKGARRTEHAPSVRRHAPQGLIEYVNPTCRLGWGTHATNSRRSSYLSPICL